MYRTIDAFGFHLYDKWLRNLRNGKIIEAFFNDNYYKSIAIYGMGLIGCQIFDELKDTNIQVCYGIDQNAQGKKIENFEIIVPNALRDKLPRPDAIVVTPMQCFFEIEKMLLDYIEDIDIVSIEQIVEYVSRGRQD